MVNTKLDRLARRREMLISRSETQRKQIAQSYQELQKPIRLAWGVIGVIQALKAHPAAVMGLTTLLFSARWGKFDKLARRLWMGWKILRPLQAWWSRSRRRL